MDNLEDLPGVGKTTAERLIEANFTSFMSIAVASPWEITDACGMGEKAARKAIQFARNNLEFNLKNGNKMLEKRKEIGRITTGSKNFDELIGGGFETGTITECHGAFSAGKTSLAHSLAINVQMSKSEGGLEGEVVWLDNENTFRPERIKQICENRELDTEKILSNIHVLRTFNSDHQLAAIEEISRFINEEGRNVKLIIIDSIMSHLRSEFCGRGSLAPRQQKLNKHLHEVLKLADINNLCAYITNQVMARPDMFFGDPISPIGGHILGHVCATRIYLRRGKAGTRVAKLVDSSYLADGAAIFTITEKGIEDA
jgi:DNA repair protein RadA